MRILLFMLLLLHQQTCWTAKLTHAPPPKPFQPRPLASSAVFSSNMPDMARLEALDVKCGRTGMNVELKFTSSFPGVVYSKGHFSEASCMYVKPNDRRSDTYRFTIPLDGCGTQTEEGGEAHQNTAQRRDRTVENTLIIQGDPLIQEVWDEARRITCTWSHSLVKSVAFLPLKVYEPKTVDVQLDARAVNTLMEIQTGLGGALPFPPTGYVHVGDEISVVMYVQGQDTDANVVSCTSTTRTATNKQEELIDARGCLLRPDLLTPFAKTRITNGVNADLMLYSYLKALDIADSPEFKITCELEICEKTCPDPCIGGPLRR